MQDLKPGYTIPGGKGGGKSHSLVVVEEKGRYPDHFTEETKTTVTNTTGKNQAQEESFAGSVTRGIQKASLTTKFLLVIAVLETGFALFFVTAKKRFKKENNKKPKNNSVIKEKKGEQNETNNEKWLSTFVCSFVS